MREDDKSIYNQMNETLIYVIFSEKVKPEYLQKR